MDVSANRFTGNQKITYTNHSPDDLNQVFFHLYYNAFQPGSEMDIRSRTIQDPDPRVRDRISKLSPDEIGYMKVTSIKHNGVPVQSFTQGTILEVVLNKPVKAGKKAIFELTFEAQVPLQIRRTGRDNKEGVRYSMSQAYPKLCMYDEHGWHANPYIGREFYGNWGNFDVKISIDSAYTVAASGVLQNPKHVGKGYADTKPSNKISTWHFIAKNVHDFMWAADPKYIHEVYHTKEGVVFHTFYLDYPEYNSNWQKLPVIMEEALAYANRKYGRYPYPVYSFIQGGDGGMEYPMGTLITGKRSLGSLVGVSVHEMMHSWYQMVLGFNESKYPWMDEGFTEYATEDIMNHLAVKGFLNGPPKENPFEVLYTNYMNLVETGEQEPLSTHADHYNLNKVYSLSTYVKGGVFLDQLSYITGIENFEKGMLTFYDAWKFKHPDDVDFIRVMEKATGLELDWYREYMIYSTKTIDYSVDSVSRNSSGNWDIYLERIGLFPMPIDVEIKYKNGDNEWVTIPLDIMRGSKPQNADGRSWKIASDWMWVNPYYVLRTAGKGEIESVTIDPTNHMADIDRENNAWYSTGANTPDQN